MSKYSLMFGIASRTSSVLRHSSASCIGRNFIRPADFPTSAVPLDTLRTPFPSSNTSGSISPPMPSRMVVEFYGPSVRQQNLTYIENRRSVKHSASSGPAWLIRGSHRNRPN